jgi:hypothetical protein
VTTEAAEAEDRSDEEVPRRYGRVIIEWPARRECDPHSLRGWGCAIYDAATGKMIPTVMNLKVPGAVVLADAQHVITADLTLLADPDGNPLLELERHPDPQGRPGHIGSEVIYAGDDGEVLTGTFSFEVAEMRIAKS